MRRAIVSGFFNPLHGGHLDMIEAAKRLGDKLIVVVNNDAQQVRKKGKVILTEQNRARLLGAIKYVDEVIIAIDSDQSVIKTLEMIARKYPGDKLIFVNGGDRDSAAAILEKDICIRYNIQMVFGAGVGKPDSSTRINLELGYE